MKILLVGPAHPLRGGIAAFNERLAVAFQEQGHQVDVLSFALQYPNFLFPGTTQFSPDPPPTDLSIYTRLNSINPFNWLQNGLYFSQKKYDLVIFRFWLPFMSPCLGTVARFFRKIPVLAITDNVLPHEKRLGDKLLTRYFLAACDGFLAMSKAVLEELKSFEPHKAQVFSPHPLYDSYGKKREKDIARQDLGLEKNGKYVLFFGLIRAYKGLDLLLEALADPRLKALDVHLILAGEFYEKADTYEAIIQKNDLEKRLSRHTFFIPSAQVATYFGAADLVVQPYRTASQSGVSQVAFHFEKPFLVTNVGGLGELVHEGKTGYLSEVSPDAIADAIFDFYENQRQDFFVKNLQTEKQNYSWEIMTKRILDLYENVKIK